MTAYCKLLNFYNSKQKVKQCKQFRSALKQAKTGPDYYMVAPLRTQLRRLRRSKPKRSRMEATKSRLCLTSVSNAKLLKKNYKRRVKVCSQNDRTLAPLEQLMRQAATSTEFAEVKSESTIMIHRKVAIRMLQPQGRGLLKINQLVLHQPPILVNPRKRKMTQQMHMLRAPNLAIMFLVRTSSPLICSSNLTSYYILR